MEKLDIKKVEAIDAMKDANLNQKIKMYCDKEYNGQIIRDIPVKNRSKFEKIYNAYYKLRK